MPVSRRDAHAAYVNLIGPDRRRSITFRHKKPGPAKFVLDSAAVHLNGESYLTDDEQSDDKLDVGGSDFDRTSNLWPRVFKSPGDDQTYFPSQFTQAY